MARRPSRKTTREAKAPPRPAGDRTLERLRVAIDRVDRRLLALLAERGRLVEQVGKHKKKRGASFHRPEREREVLARLVAENPGPYPDEAIEAFWREVMSASLALESPLTVAVADDDAARVARRRFGSAARLRREEGPAEVVDAVARGWAGYGVIAVEDSAAGFRGAALDAIADGGAPVSGEALATADGVTVRALIVGGEPHAPTEDDLTTVVIVPRDEPGAVAAVLAVFGRHGVNLRRIEARPQRAGARAPRARWDYRFIADLDGHRDRPPLADALAELARGGALVRVLGSYPRSLA